MGLATRAAKWSAANWKKAAFGWLAFALTAATVGQAVGTVKLTEAEQGSGESAKAQTMLERAGFGQLADEAVLVQSARLKVADRRFTAVLGLVVDRLEGMAQVRDVRSPLAHTDAGAVSRDGHSVLVQFSIRGSADTAPSRVQPVLSAVAAIQRRSPGFTVAEFGEASAARALSSAHSGDLALAAELSVPITFVILLIAFGAFAAACIPVVLAFSAVLAAAGLAALTSHVLHQSESSSSVMLLMGMAVGVDYSLFYLRREREERRRGRARTDALQLAAATSGHAVLVSGLTVIVAMAGMMLTGSRIFTSLGVSAMLVVFTAMIGSLTVLPALLGRLGDNVERGSLRRARRVRETSRAWNVVLGPVLRFPRMAVALSAVLLLVLASPLLRMHTSLPSTGDLLRGTPIASTYARVQHAFPGASRPAYVVISAPNVTSPTVRSALAAMERSALASGQAREPMHTLVNGDHTVAQVEIPLVGSGEDAASINAVRTLRERVLPSTFARLPGVSYSVTGEAAGTLDFNQTMKSHAAIVFAFVLGLAFLLLLAAFRSLVIPVTSIALNLLSVGAAYGVLVWIFQDGHLQSLLGFHSDGAVVAWLPLFLFPVLFGLSMDYHVFILSRIKELHERGASTSEAVSRGIRTSAGVVTAAAVVMVAVFAIFASLPTLELKQMGVGLAVAVLIDATLIRGVLLPATMKLLGERNWYLPQWLRWLPHMRLGRHRLETAAETT